MQKSNSTNRARMAQRRVASSTTLSRQYVRRPQMGASVIGSVEKSPQIGRFSADFAVTSQSAQMQSDDQPMMPPEIHPLQNTVNAKMRSRQSQWQTSSARMSARELKEQAVQQALAATMTPEKTTAKKKTKKDFGKVHFGFGRVVLALSCAAVAVLAIVYFVNLNMPDISLKVAAMQTGINAAYPGYVPRDYAISSITSEDKKVTMEFKNNTSGDAFTLTEETSSWDSDALLNNYVKGSYRDNYTVIREQGLTIYISGSNATWVNGGVVYKIITTNGSLTNKQIKSIATSL